jgi:hypothetical protein
LYGNHGPQPVLLGIKSITVKGLPVRDKASSFCSKQTIAGNRSAALPAFLLSSLFLPLGKFCVKHLLLSTIVVFGASRH